MGVFVNDWAIVLLQLGVEKDGMVLMNYRMLPGLCASARFVHLEMYEEWGVRHLPVITVAPSRFTSYLSLKVEGTTPDSAMRKCIADVRWKEPPAWTLFATSQPKLD